MMCVGQRTAGLTLGLTAIRLVRALLVEVNVEMIFSGRRYIAAGSLATFTIDQEESIASLPAAPRT